MAIKNIKRQKRATKTRSKIELSENNRLTVFRSNSHIYAQVSTFDGTIKSRYLSINMRVGPKNSKSIVFRQFYFRSSLSSSFLSFNVFYSHFFMLS